MKNLYDQTVMIMCNPNPKTAINIGFIHPRDSKFEPIERLFNTHDIIKDIASVAPNSQGLNIVHHNAMVRSGIDSLEDDTNLTMLLQEYIEYVMDRYTDCLIQWTGNNHILTYYDRFLDKETMVLKQDPVPRTDNTDLVIDLITRLV